MTYCPGLVPSIVSADSFHFSVRNGKRWDQIAPITGKFHFSNKPEGLSNKEEKKQKCNLYKNSTTRPLVLVSLTSHDASTASLSTSYSSRGLRTLAST